MGLMPKDRWLLATFVIACIASIAATWYFFQQNQILIYNDAASHLGMARLVYDSAKPGFGQLGGVWLPLPHLLLIPFTAIDSLWQTGLAGACVSMPCYIITALYIFLTVRKLTGNSVASFVGALVFILNPNVLYLQATPLTEPLAAATMTAASYYFVLWLKDDKPTNLILLAAATFLGTLTRYDGWALFMGIFALVPFISLIKYRKRHRVEANVIVFTLLGCLGIGLWLLWCQLIFGDPLYFQRSVYSAQSQQQGFIASNTLYTYHNVGESIRFFIGLALASVGPGIFALSLIGLFVFVWRRRFSLDLLVALVFLIPFGFYIFSLFAGQIVIYLPGYVPADSPKQFFNTRYGMAVIPTIALFLGVYAAELSSTGSKWLKRFSPTRRISYRTFVPGAFSAIIVLQSVLVGMVGIVSLQDGQYGMSCSPPQKIITYLAAHYDGEPVLIDTFTAPNAWAIAARIGIHLKNYIYQGSGAVWDQALEDPAAHVNWVLLNPYSTLDEVAKNLDTTSLKFRLDFTLVEENLSGLRLYRRNGLPPLPERTLSRDVMAGQHLCPES
jgi:hypothetical protein